MNTRHIPSNAKEITRDGLNGVVYTYEIEGTPCAMAYYGKRSKPSFHYRYRSLEERNEAIEKFFKRIAANANWKNEQNARQKERRAEFLRKLEVGSILETCWGYEQTNVEWYQVTKLKGSTVYLREIAADVKETSFMSGTTTPIKGKFVGEELKRVVRGTSIRISDSTNAYLSNGRPGHCSWYA